MKKTQQTMHSVEFITCESGKDLIVSFAISAPNELGGIESLTLLRTPLYEPLREDWERGISVSFERHDDEDDYLEDLLWDEANAIVRMKTRRRSYELDLRNVDRSEQLAMCKVLKNMNFDRRIEMRGICPLLDETPPDSDS
jgi:hypothetical protein